MAASYQPHVSERNRRDRPYGRKWEIPAFRFPFAEPRNSNFHSSSCVAATPAGNLQTGFPCPPSYRLQSVPVFEMLPGHPSCRAGRPSYVSTPARHAISFGTPVQTVCRASCFNQAGSDTLQARRQLDHPRPSSGKHSSMYASEGYYLPSALTAAVGRDYRRYNMKFENHLQ